MQELKLDIMQSKGEQLKVLVPYLEKVAKGDETSLPATTQTKVLISRYLWNWTSTLYDREGLTPRGAFLLYKKLVGSHK